MDKIYTVVFTHGSNYINKTVAYQEMMNEIRSFYKNRDRDTLLDEDYEPGDVL